MNFILASLSITALSASLMVTIPNGNIQGKVETNLVNSFLKIPYAKPPIGDLRFEDPEPFTDPYDNGIYDATISGPACPQSPGLVLPNQPQSEDCLYLRVLVPNTATPASNYPVLIFIHGGQYIFGTGLDFFTNAKTMVETSISNNNPIIVVTINYRLGVFGFFYDEKYKTGIDGNFGIKDQELAIRWVHKNIAAFGGDPNKLTLLGESAGASSIGIHLTNKNLNDISDSIVGAIMWSLYVGERLNTVDLHKNAQIGELFIDETGCQLEADILDCLQNTVTTETIIEMQSKYPFVYPNFIWAPIVDRQYIKFQIWRAFERGYGIWSKNKKDMNILIGYNKDEGKLFESLYLQLLPDVVLNTVDELKTFFINRDADQLNNVNINQATAIYDEMFTGLGLDTSGLTVTEAYDVYTDLNIFKCPINNIADSIAGDTKNNHNIYKYYFTEVDFTLNALTFGAFSPSCITTTCHGQELYYIFRSPEAEGFFGLFIPGYTYSQTVIDSSIILQKIIAQFTTDGTTGIDANIWPQYAINNRVTKELSISTVNNPATNINPQQCSVLDGIGYAADYNNVAGGSSAAASFKNIAPKTAGNTVYVLHISWSHIIGVAVVLFVFLPIILYLFVLCRKQNTNKYSKVDMVYTDDEEKI